MAAAKVLGGWLAGCDGCGINEAAAAVEWQAAGWPAGMEDLGFGSGFGLGLKVAMREHFTQVRGLRGAAANCHHCSRSMQLGGGGGLQRMRLNSLIAVLYEGVCVRACACFSCVQLQAMREKARV